MTVSLLSITPLLITCVLEISLKCIKYAEAIETNVCFYNLILLI